jgi:hypothetical protein
VEYLFGRLALAVAIVGLVAGVAVTIVLHLVRSSNERRAEQARRPPPPPGSPFN